jgi:hypothetical protein
MSANSSKDLLTQSVQRRRLIRYFAALMAALTAVMYFLIGFRVVTVLGDTNADQSFGFFAGAAYALGAVLLVAFERRIVWILGAALQVFVIYTYFDLASQRTPTFEIWGILIRIAQVFILVALAYLAMRLPFNQSTNQQERKLDA